MDLSPWASTDGAGNWVATWVSETASATRSERTTTFWWQARRTTARAGLRRSPLNTNAATDTGEDDLPQLATDGAGRWVAVWESTDSLEGAIGTDTDILVALSSDNGMSWSAPSALNTNAASDSGDDRDPQVVVVGPGDWLALWRSDDSLGGAIGTDSDLLISRSTDNGVSWSPPTPLSPTAATNSGRAVAPRVRTDGAGNWVAVWYSSDSLGGTIGGDSDIFVSRSVDDGTTWSAPVFLNTNAPTDLGSDTWPRLSTDAAGNWIAIWQSRDSLGDTIGIDEDILVARSTDNGSSWSPPAVVNSNAATDSIADLRPQVSTDGMGNWVAVWAAQDFIGTPRGNDSDVLVARSHRQRNELEPALWPQRERLF